MTSRRRASRELYAARRARLSHKHGRYDGPCSRDSPASTDRLEHLSAEPSVILAFFVCLSCYRRCRAAMGDDLPLDRVVLGPLDTLRAAASGTAARGAHTPRRLDTIAGERGRFDAAISPAPTRHPDASAEPKDPEAGSLCGKELPLNKKSFPPPWGSSRLHRRRIIKKYQNPDSYDFTSGTQLLASTLHLLKFQWDTAPARWVFFSRDMRVFWCTSGAQAAYNWISIH